MTEARPTRLLEFHRRPATEILERARAFCEAARRRRSVRHYSSEEFPIEIVERCIEVACCAPSGANKQPWTFVLVTDRELKRQLREGAEREEAAFYAGRASQQWLRDVGPLGTGPDKPFLEDAPAVVAVFARKYGDEPTERHYFVSESVGIAVGFLLAALHHAGLAALVYTPSPIKFVQTLLERPTNERALCLIPVGFPVEDCQVPDIQRRNLDEVLIRR